MHPSSNLPPHPRPHRPRVTTPSALSFYISACFKPSQTAHANSPSTAAAAGYGVYIHSTDPPLHLHLSEPLAQRHQSLPAAAHAALASTLTIALPQVSSSVSTTHRLRVVSDSPHLYQSLEFDPPFAHGNETPFSEKLQALIAEYHAASIPIDIVKDPHRIDAAPLRKACDLAREAVSAHAFCRLCRRNYGRGGTPHQCHPVCFVPPCRGARFVSQEDFEQHVEDRHPIKRVYPESGVYKMKPSQRGHTSSDESSTDSLGNCGAQCPQCAESFSDYGSLANHVEGKCSKALESWYEQTDIVKM